MVRILIADNSQLNRARLKELLPAENGQIEIVGEASCGAECVRLTKRLKPQVVVMGVLKRSPPLNKPLDDLTATQLIMSEVPTPIVVVLSAEEKDESRARALLDAGAVAVLDQGKLDQPTQRGAQNELFETVRIMSGVKVVGQRLRNQRRATHVVATPAPRVQCVAIAASTGGPHAITHVLKALPKDLPVPVIIVQHMAHGFVPGFTKWLDSHCALPVKLVEHVERLRPGVAYVAADGAHLRVIKHQVSAEHSAKAPWFALHPTPGEPYEGFMPSASVLFESVAEAFGAHAVAVILTGMGRDGLSGLRKVREHGGRILAQNQETSVVFGMPHVAIEAGIADYVLPIDRMAAQILELVRAKEPQ